MYVAAEQPSGLAPRSPGLPAAGWALPVTTLSWGNKRFNQHFQKRLGHSGLL